LFSGIGLQVVRLQKLNLTLQILISRRFSYSVVERLLEFSFAFPAEPLPLK
jgi:hypothetical protein